jgi:hypothetical protein
VEAEQKNNNNNNDNPTPVLRTSRKTQILLRPLVPAMTAGKLYQQLQQQQQVQLSMCSLKGSLLTLAILTLISFTYLSFNSLHSSPSPSISASSVSLLPATETTTKTVVVDVGDGENDEISDLYHSPRVFKLNYEEMEQNFKIYIYPDGDPNTFYQTPRKLTGKYASEGYFFQNIRESRFRTLDPDQAHLFFIPISCHKMRGKVSNNFVLRLLS